MSESNRSKFVFSDAPFASSPNADAFCEIGTCADAFARSRRAIENSEGPAILIGGPGTGKTMVCVKLAEELGSRYHVVPVMESHLETSRDLLQAILYQLDLPYRDVEEGEMRLNLLDFLRPKGKSNDDGLLLILDEAHQLGVELLEEVRMISNVTALGKPRVRTLLAGGPGLDETLSDPQLASFSQRIAARCYLSPFNSAETAEYIRCRLSRVGAVAHSVIDESAIRRVHSACDGIPRLINQLMSHVLYFADRQDAAIVSDALVQAAWADLQQLPMPMGAQTRPSPQPGATIASGATEPEDFVEFGELEPERNAQPTVEDAVPVESIIEADADDPEPVAHEPTIDRDADLAEETLNAEGFAVCVSQESSDQVEGAGIDVVGHALDNIPSDLAAELEVICRESSALRLQDVTGAESSALIMNDWDDRSPTNVDTKPVNTLTGNLHDFPVVRLGSPPKDVPSFALEAMKNAAPATIDLNEKGLSAETACYQDNVLRIANGDCAQDLATEIKFSTPSDRVIEQVEAMSVMSDELWNAAINPTPSRKPVVEHPERSSTKYSEPSAPSCVQAEKELRVSPEVVGNPFGDGYEEELPLENGKDQQIRIAVGSVTRPISDHSGLAIQDPRSGNESSVEFEQELHDQVVSMNREATSTNKAVMQGFFGGKRSGAASHLNDISVNGDDRDLMIIEDQINDEPAALIQPRRTSGAPNTDLSNLFTRIREG